MSFAAEPMSAPTIEATGVAGTGNEVGLRMPAARYFDRFCVEEASVPLRRDGVTSRVKKQ